MGHFDGRRVSGHDFSRAEQAFSLRQAIQKSASFLAAAGLRAATEERLRKTLNDPPVGGPQ